MLYMSEPKGAEHWQRCVLYLQDRLAQGHRNTEVVARWRHELLRAHAEILTLQNHGEARLLRRAS